MVKYSYSLQGGLTHRIEFKSKGEKQDIEIVKKKIIEMFKIEKHE